MKKIAQCVEVYSKENVYDIDNQLILKGYSEKILESERVIAEGNRLRAGVGGGLLELGLGHGYATLVFNDFFEKHIVLEGDDDVIRKFQLNNPGSTARIIKTYFEEYTSLEKFDVVVLGFILEHVDNPVAILKKYKKFLKKNGRMYVAVPNAESLNRRVGVCAGFLSDIMQLSDHDKMLGHKRYYTVNKIKEDCHLAGLTIEWMEGLYLKPLTTRQMRELGLSDELYRAFCKVGRTYPELCLGILAEVKDADHNEK